MKLFLSIILIVAICTPTATFANDQLPSDGMSIFVRQPEVPYEEIGIIVFEDDLADTETSIAQYATLKLKSQARKLGANAFIVRNVSRFPAVYDDPADYNKSPPVITHMIKMRFKIEAMAIKVDYKK